MPLPNILYIHSHDTGRFTQPYGHAIPTPNIHALAEGGVLFRQAFCAGPTCSPSRAALLTGQCPHSSGMLGLAHRGFSLKDYNQHLIHTLRDAGYYSALVGVQHVAAESGAIGYDRVSDPNVWCAESVGRAGAEFLEGDRTEPFFLSVGFQATHRAFPPPRTPSDANNCLPPPPLPDTPETRADMAAFKASAADLDHSMGIVLDALEAEGLAENTLVICTTDHGIAFPGMKCNLTDSGIGVQLIMRGPGGFEGGRACDALVSQIDLFPTLCDLLKLDPPSWLQGKSMMPLFRGDEDEINEEVFAEVTYHAAYEPQRAVRTQRWKYIRRFNDRGKPVLPNCDDGPSKDVWMNYGWKDRNLPKEELYDLVFDTNETNNLADDDTKRSILEEMRDRLDQWMKRTEDPLLQGPVSAPRGAYVNDPDGISPSETPRRC